MVSSINIFEQDGIKMVEDDCYNLLCSLPDSSIDLLLQDLPYDATKNEWDLPVDLPKMWEQWLRVIKPNGAMVFTAQQPFTTDLIMSNRKHFRYDIIWAKRGKATGFLNANKMPLRAHEDILVFYKELPTYNPQKTGGKLNHNKNRGRYKAGKSKTNNNYGDFNQNFETEATDDNFPVSIIEFQIVHPPIHPTQKPVDLMRWLIRSYSNEGETVFDGYFGSASGAKACVLENRKFIGAENYPEYFKLGVEGVKLEMSRPMMEFHE